MLEGTHMSHKYTFLRIRSVSFLQLYILFNNFFLKSIFVSGHPGFDKRCFLLTRTKHKLYFSGMDDSENYHSPQVKINRPGMTIITCM